MRSLVEHGGQFQGLDVITATFFAVYGLKLYI
jgi:hypothetical protein